MTRRGFIGRGERIRTSDPLLPKQMRYQAALLPVLEEIAKYQAYSKASNLVKTERMGAKKSRKSRKSQDTPRPRG